MKPRRSRLNVAQTDDLLACFVSGMPARPAAEVAGVNRNTAQLFYHRLREGIAHRLAREEPLGSFIDAAELDSDDPSLRPRGTGVARVVPLCGLIEHESRVHLVPIEGERPADASGSLRLEALVCADETAETSPDAAPKWRRMRLVLRQDVAGDPVRRQRLRSFWNQSLRHLRRFNGVPRQHLFLYLKECEWRCNGDTNEELLQRLQTWGLAANREL